MLAATLLPILMAAAGASAPPPAGLWHAALVPAAGVEVAFDLRVDSRGGRLSALLVNGGDERPFTSAAWDGETLTLDLAHLDGRLTARRSGSGLEGLYRRTTSAGTIEVPFRASREAPAPPKAPGGAASVGGEGGIDMGQGQDASKVLGTFRQAGGRVSGTVLEETGDWGPLHGSWDGRRLVLTEFDGIHVYRMTAELAADGTLRGEFRSRSSDPVPWTGRRVRAEERKAYLPGGFDVVKAKDPKAPFVFSYPDEEGHVVSSGDPRYAGKAMVVTITGTWCPNCNDEAPVLKELAARDAARGLEVASLAFEYTPEVERSRRQVKRFRERYGLPYAVLVAGTTKEAKGSAAIAQLEGWEGFPTTIFLDRDHRIVRVHSGFDGPATGERFARLKKEIEATVEGLLTPPRGGSSAPPS